MMITEHYGDLFEACNILGLTGLHYAHCISSDYAMGAGIAKAFDHRFHLKENLRLHHPDRLPCPSCCRVHHVYNLVTKENYWDKPTYESLTISLVHMRNMMMQEGVKTVAMPQIGCGLDRLDWDHVYGILERVFTGYPLEIVVFRLTDGMRTTL